MRGPQSDYAGSSSRPGPSTIGPTPPSRRPDKWCKVPLTYGEKVEVIVVGTQVGRGRLDEALNKLDESRKEIGAFELPGEGRAQLGGVVRSS